MRGTVQECKLSTSGKSYALKVDGKFFSAKLDSKLDSMVGKSIDFDTEQTEYKGKTFYWVTTWGPTVGVGAAPASPKPVGELVAPLREPSRANGDRWWLPFVSNQCAHAIAAGQIKGVADLRSWAQAAKRAIERADENDDDIPL